MGNNASTNGQLGNRPSLNRARSTTRKSTASHHEQVRKSSASNNQNNSLDEEFSDLILHQVVKQPESGLISPTRSSSNVPTTESSQNYNQFSNDLIEDEFNELNDGLVEESTSLSRNILPDNQFFGTNRSKGESSQSSDNMELDEPFTQDSDDIQEYEHQLSQTPTPDLSKVDFTKITNHAQQQQQSIQGDSDFTPQPPPPSATRMLSAASVARNAHSPSPNLEQQTNTQTNQHHHNKSYINNNQYLQQQSRTKQSKSNNHRENILIPIEIKWVNTNKEQINKIAIIGSFSNWRDVIKLSPSLNHPGEYVTTINLPLGVHKLLYIINNEYRVSDQLPTATDQEGIFFNWFEVIDDTHLFNHSLHQANHVGASTDYDANIISHQDANAQCNKGQQQQQQDHNSPLNSTPRLAGRYEVERIQEKANDLLHKMSKESSSQFEHLEFVEDVNDNMVDEGDAELQAKQEQQQNSENYPYSGQQQQQQHHHSRPSSRNHSNSEQFIPYELSKSNSFIKPDKKLQYSNEIPEMFVNYDYFKSKPADYELPEPPQLPPHLNNVLLNKISQHSGNSSSNLIPSPSSSSTQPPAHGGLGSSSPSYSYKRPPLRRADSSYYASNKEAYHLSIPNHVILNHLMTTSIKNEVLTVACITRYSGKFVTQIMHSPADA
ncbi:Kis2 scaffold protein of Snf1p complex [Candida orthopsilosis Co 90-125]|uniref:Kis2 scaffold protein of Snf1p complex n=1 Tax=Candida orthopsilosis (strain 90-125) TaxID=1136231 RepID=H8X4Q3_CANO9|nr:Kis2 scaffold protein of Snf1p complex [Candida orthopsilosis Co 90-125]CCG22995.1 Kis2 scaffold protein of Snf1p complex [Candida orthopsilosis Co 90-125]